MTSTTMRENAGMYLGNDRRNRVVALVLAGVLVASVILALLATVATAAPTAAAAPAGAAGPLAVPMHTRLVAIVPADGARLDAAPTQIILTFDEPVPADLARVALTRDGETVQVGAVTATGTSLSAPITGQLHPASYRIAWRATSDDGHPVSGESGFTVTGPAGAGSVAAPLATPTDKARQTRARTVGYPDHLPGLVVGGALLLGGVVLLLHEQRRRAAHPEEPVS